MFRVKGPISFQFMRALSKAETLRILSTDHVEFVHKPNKVTQFSHNYHRGSSTNERQELDDLARVVEFPAFS